MLGVDKNVSKGDLKKAYFQLAQKHHPDKNPNDASAQEKFAEISSAYEVLADDERRKAYDQFGHQAEEARQQGGQGGFTDAADLFAELSEEEGGRYGGNPFEAMFEQQTEREQRGSDIQTSMRISFMEAVNGCSKTFQAADKSCDTCGGSGNKVGTKPVTCKLMQGFWNHHTATDDLPGANSLPSLRRPGF